jgi:thymidine kinase
MKMRPQRYFGNLTVICGPMFSGKTGLLIERIVADTGPHLVLKPAMDTRFAIEAIVSRAGGRIMAQPVDHWLTLSAEIRTLYLDEVQFMEPPYFSGMLHRHVHDALKSGIDVVASGLDMDFAGLPFDVTARLAAMADQVIKLAACCTACGQTARKSMRRFGSADRVALGDCESYSAACNHCFTTVSSEDHEIAGA